MAGSEWVWMGSELLRSDGCKRYLMTLLAGALRMNFLTYLTAGTAGRLVRFGALVTLPQLALSYLKGGA